MLELRRRFGCLPHAFGHTTMTEPNQNKDDRFDEESIVIDRYEGVESTTLDITTELQKLKERNTKQGNR